MNICTPSTRPIRRGSPRGFTLVELLVVMVILSILSSMVLMALSNTQASARDARTRGTITKLDALIMAKWETYQTRRVPLKNVSGNTDRKSFAQKRLFALRELIRQEMPDQHTDISIDPATDTSGRKYNYIKYRTSASLAYFNIFKKATRDIQYQSAECLYLIVAHGLNDPDALSQFNESEINDVDGDGLKEFIDGWGNPISFLRWAPDFISPIQEPDPSKPGYQPDPLDPMKQTSGRSFALYPLIYSAGPDRRLDIENRRNDPNNPYEAGLGAWNDVPNDGENNSLDNITNHELQAY